MRRMVVLYNLLFLNLFTYSQLPVFKNPGIPGNESYEISDHLDHKVGTVTATVKVALQNEGGKPYYLITVNEGNIFLNQMKLNYQDLTTVFEKRTDLRSKQLAESFSNDGMDVVHFYNSKDHINKYFETNNRNIYSRYAYFFSFQGFPFLTRNSVQFKTYVSEYGGNALTMNLKYIGKQMLHLESGVFESYKLELSVGGWQSIFASQKYYLYYDVDSPHQFLKFDQMGKDGKWYSNELLTGNK